MGVFSGMVVGLERLARRSRVARFALWLIAGGFFAAACAVFLLGVVGRIEGVLGGLAGIWLLAVAMTTALIPRGLARQL